MIHNAGEQRCEYCNKILIAPVENRLENLTEMMVEHHQKGCPVQKITGCEFENLSWKERKFYPVYKINPYNLIYWNRGWTSGFAGEQEPKNHYSNGFCPNSFRLGWQMGNAAIENAADAAAESCYSFHSNEY